MLLVLDASVAVKMVTNERGSDLAQALLAHTLVAPDLLATECANALWRKSRTGSLSEQLAREALDLLLSLDIELVASRRLLPSALIIGQMLAHPLYDCLYLALAADIGAPAVTVDNRLYLKARSTPETANLVLRLGEAA